MNYLSDNLNNFYSWFNCWKCLEGLLKDKFKKRGHCPWFPVVHCHGPADNIKGVSPEPRTNRKSAQVRHLWHCQQDCASCIVVLGPSAYGSYWSFFISQSSLGCCSRCCLCSFSLTFVFTLCLLFYVLECSWEQQILKRSKWRLVSPCAGCQWWSSELSSQHYFP